MLTALSVATDLGMGQPPETALRSCLLGTGLARALELPEAEVRDVYLGALLRHVGCTATASVEARLYGGDELMSRRAAQPADFGSSREVASLTLGIGLAVPGSGRGGSPIRLAVLRLPATELTGPELAQELFVSVNPP